MPGFCRDSIKIAAVFQKFTKFIACEFHYQANFNFVSLPCFNPKGWRLKFVSMRGRMLGNLSLFPVLDNKSNKSNICPHVPLNLEFWTEGPK